MPQTRAVVDTGCKLHRFSRAALLATTVYLCPRHSEYEAEPCRVHFCTTPGCGFSVSMPVRGNDG